MYHPSSGKTKTKAPPYLDSPEGRKYMRLLVQSVLHQMKINQTKKGGPQKEHTK
ncbi:hypothetical protein [Paenibacillus odorifer]|uniref:hypothetical protein n=1 Tax=Paenibacillus odorifer TaxID=189426 RepID=UPI000B1CBB27|nr:hypothetical protein [Paenibacillus odorifer]